MNKLLNFIGAASILASGSASAVIVEGVDFGAAGALNHIETTTLAETFVNGDGQNLMGYGQINTVNGNSSYATTAGNLLYFVFENYTTQNFSPASSGFTGGVVNIYLGSLGNLLDQDSATNVANIQGLGGPWATLSGHAFNAAGDTLTANGTLTGSTALAFTGQGLLDVVGGLAAVVNFLDVNTISDSLGGNADIGITTSASNLVLNPFDDTTSCSTLNPTVGDFCLAGSADIRGSTNVVPEPSIIALLGVGLLGFGTSSLRKKKSV